MARGRGERMRPARTCHEGVKGICNLTDMHKERKKQAYVRNTAYAWPAEKGEFQPL